MQIMQTTLASRDQCWNGTNWNGDSWLGIGLSIAYCRGYRFLPNLRMGLVGSARICCDLWKAGTAQTLAWSGYVLGLHKRLLLCTGLFGVAVGDVGNQGRVKLREGRFSKPPDLHRQDLENPASSQVTALQTLRKDFHFFYLHYGDYYLFLLSLYSFPHRPSLGSGSSPELKPSLVGSPLSGVETPASLRRGFNASLRGEFRNPSSFPPPASSQR